MAMPNELVLVRHGQSEGNIIQGLGKKGFIHEQSGIVNDRPDWQHRLSNLGIEQAKIAKKWLDENLGGAAHFDARYVSPFMRTRETAAYLGGEETGEWTIDDRIVEKSWGIYGTVSRPEQEKLFPMTAKLHHSSPWYVRFDGGESMPDVYGRFRDFQATLHREQAGKRVLAVTHGDYINVARYGIERMLPEQWEAMDRDDAYYIRNCSITIYSRVNPQDASDVRDKIHWRRIIYPESVFESPDKGAWVELPDRQRYTGRELLEQIKFAPRLLENV